MDETRVSALIITMSFRAPWCRSLKDKRSEVKRILSRLRAAFNLSAVESGHQDSHTLFDITIAALAFGQAQADSIQESVLRLAQSVTEAELYGVESELL
ncbi:MAG: DUF503 domain-containing protein [Clostridiales bacterium]|nr:DUF503 domain-containing protein [Clostridiales bacterium]